MADKKEKKDLIDNPKMKEYDRVELISDKKKFADLGLEKGRTGTILGPKRNGYWYVVFEGRVFLGEDGIWDCTDISAAVLDEDVKVIWESPYHAPKEAE